ncbi:MAG TPA: DUF4126 family protein [Chthoniobacterales bacterium]|nr:DUF4126 family protein [Chthoniobacterales bacterium]
MLALALLIGVVAGLRTLTPLAAVSWAANLGWLQLDGTWLSFLGASITPYIVTALALAELVGDKLPKTPSRKVPIQFGTRILVGALCGAALATPGGATLIGILLGAIGAVIGTLGGAAARARLARAFGNDLPAALLEDAVAVGSAVVIVSRFS